MPKGKNIETTRVIIIGAGSVGATTAFSIMIQGIASEIVLIDKNQQKAQGEARDLEQGLSFIPKAKIWAGNYTDCATADVVIITAGLPQKTGQSRLELTKTNSQIVAGIVKEVRKYSREAIILVVTNPLDIMTYVAIKASKTPAGTVFGSGTTLDSSRFRFYLAQKTNIDAESVGAYILGEHGDSSVPIYSHANIMGQPISSIKGYSKKDLADAYKVARNAAYEVIEKKGATYYAIALAATRIVRAIIYDENHIFPVSTLVDGQYGIRNVCLSLPAVIGRRGVKKVIPIKMTNDELKKLKRSAIILKKNIERAKI